VSFPSQAGETRVSRCDSRQGRSGALYSRNRAHALIFPANACPVQYLG